MLVPGTAYTYRFRTLRMMVRANQDGKITRTYEFAGLDKDHPQRVCAKIAILNQPIVSQSAWTQSLLYSPLLISLDDVSVLDCIWRGRVPRELLSDMSDAPT